MPNLASYDLLAKGPTEGIEALLAAFDYDNENARHFCRIFDADVIERTQNDDGTETVEIVGDCAWSALVCMTSSDKVCYTNANTNAISIEELSDTYGLAIEVHDCECGMEFATRLVKRPNEPLEETDFNYCEIDYEPGYDDLDELKSDYDLTDDEVKMLKNGDFVIRTNMDFDEWHI